MLRKIGAVVALVVIALVAYFLLRPSGEADAEAKYDGVHLCSASQQAAATARGAPGPSRQGTPSPSDGRGGAAAALFAQNSPVWGSEEYDHGKMQNIGCGATIAQCGCAMTSVATVLRLFQNLTTPDGTELSPSTLNAWFNKGAQLTSSGWASQGYIYGNVVWTAVNNFSAAVPSPLVAAPGASAGGSATAIRFKGWGTGSDQEIKSELAAGRPVVLEVPGHYIAAIGLQGDVIQINDPAYKDRTTLDAYAGRVKSSRLFEPGQDLRALVITVPADQRVRVTDSKGRAVGTLAKGNPADAEKGAKADIPGATYHFEAAWRDPTCTEKPPPDGAGVNTVFIPQPEKGTYTVEVLGAHDTVAAVYSYDRNGNLKMETHGGGNNIQFQIGYEEGAAPPVANTPIPATPATGTATATPTTPAGVPGARAAATDTPTPVPADTSGPTTAPGGGDQPVSTPNVSTVADTVTPTATLTPNPGGPMTPGTLTVKLQESKLALPDGSIPGCQTQLSWETKGDPNGKVDLLRNSTSIFSTSVGVGSFSDPFVAGTWKYQVRATNSGGQDFLSPEVSVTPFCLSSFNVGNTTSPCGFTLSWLVEGNASGNVSLLRRFSGAGFQVLYSEALTANARSFMDNFAPTQAVRDYEIEVAVQDRTVDSIVKAISSSCTPVTPTPPTLTPTPLPGLITIVEDQASPCGIYGFSGTGGIGAFSLSSKGALVPATGTSAGSFVCVPTTVPTSMDFTVVVGTSYTVDQTFKSAGAKGSTSISCTGPATIGPTAVTITVMSTTPNLHITCTFFHDSG